MRELLDDIVEFLRDWVELIGWVILAVVLGVLIKLSDLVDKL